MTHQQLSSALIENLVQQACEARQRAYARYSGFAVGAAILTSEGQIVTGANVENASYGLTICAERVAASTAVAGGARQFAAVAITTTGAHAPCGACRQFLAEFGDPMLLLADPDTLDPPALVPLSELLPRQFEFPNQAPFSQD